MGTTGIFWVDEGVRWYRMMYVVYRPVRTRWMRMWYSVKECDWDWEEGGRTREWMVSPVKGNEGGEG